MWRLSISTRPEAEEAVSEWLEKFLRQPAVSYTELRTGQTTVTVFLERKPDWSKAVRDRIHAGLSTIERSGLAVGPQSFMLRRLRKEDWAESWKKHFKPMVFGSRLLIRPSWSKTARQRGQVEVILDPGLSFGTGQHPTTAFCLEQIVKRARRIRGQALLDAGTGSGILAISAAKLGYGPVEALEFDPEALRVARRNARINGVAGRIRFHRADATKLGRRPRRHYAVICANLLASVLVQARDRLVERLEPGGVLLAAGILASEFAEVEHAFKARGLKLAVSRHEQEWRSGAFAS